MTGDAERGRAWPRQDPEEVQEWLGQTNLIYGGLIAIGVVMVQPFLTARSLDVSSRICIVAFSVAIPLLAVLVMINRQEAFRRRLSKSILVASAQVVGQLAAFLGVVAGFWHIIWIAWVGILGSGLAGVTVHTAVYTRLERDRETTPQLADDMTTGVLRVPLQHWASNSYSGVRETFDRDGVTE